jgi:predicted Fe-S protein YdhL (DUF1289 family)
MTEQLVSPCISICEIDPQSGTCRGCWRSREEIARWPFMTAPEQRLLLEKLHARRAAQTGQPLRPGRRRSAREGKSQKLANGGKI